MVNSEVEYCLEMGVLGTDLQQGPRSWGKETDTRVLS